MTKKRENGMTLITTSPRMVQILLEEGWIVQGTDYRGWIMFRSISVNPQVPTYS